MANHVDPHDETPSAPFRRVLSLIDGLPPSFKPSDQTPLREAMPGGWPTIGEFRSFLHSIQPPPPSSHVAVPDFRALAVDIVDGIRGYTYEFSGHPAAHSADYDLIEEKLRAALATTEGKDNG